MKQVAKKSTTSLPQKLSAGNHQPNGLLRGSSVPEIAANTTSESSDIELTNGVHTSCEQISRNDTVPSTSNHSRASAAADTIQQQTVQHSVCTVTSASVSAVSAPLPTNSQTSANVQNVKDMPVPVKHASAVTTKPHAASITTLLNSANSTNDVIVVKSDDAVAIKPDIDSVKRCLSSAEDKKCEVKKARLDGAVEGNSQLTREV